MPAESDPFHTLRQRRKFRRSVQISTRIIKKKRIDKRNKISSRFQFDAAAAAAVAATAKLETNNQSAMIAADIHLSVHGVWRHLDAKRKARDPQRYVSPSDRRIRAAGRRDRSLSPLVTSLQAPPLRLPGKYLNRISRRMLNDDRNEPIIIFNHGVCVNEPVDLNRQLNKNWIVIEWGTEWVAIVAIYPVLMPSDGTGRLVMGCGGSYVQRQPDILVQGTGVEPIHCYVENVAGVVTLYPLAQMTYVDGMPIQSPVRLIQGNPLWHPLVCSSSLTNIVAGTFLGAIKIEFRRIYLFIRHFLFSLPFLLFKKNWLFSGCGFWAPYQMTVLNVLHCFELFCVVLCIYDRVTTSPVFLARSHGVSASSDTPSAPHFPSPLSFTIQSVISEFYWLDWHHRVGLNEFNDDSKSLFKNWRSR